MRATLWKLHQWLGVMTCIGVLMWGLSGVMHPVMSRLQPRPASFMPPGQSIDLSQATPLAAVLASQNVARIEQGGLATVGGVPAYRVQMPGTAAARYFAVTDGKEIAQADRIYAEELARHYTGLKDAAVSDIRLLTAFDGDYPPVNKLLPVWRVAFDRGGGLRAYVDTSQARLATLSDDRKQVLSDLFRLAHTWSFAEGTPMLQITVMSGILACILFSALSGIYFYAILRPTAARRLRGRVLTRWHRLLGVSVSFFALTAVFSGSYHLFHAFAHRDDTVPALQQTYDVAMLGEAGWSALARRPLASLSLADLDGRPVWQAVPASASGGAGPRAQVANLASPGNDKHAHHHHGAGQGGNPPVPPRTLVFDASTGATGAAPQAVALQLAAAYARRPPEQATGVSVVSSFGGEYGFFFKRLPVYRVEFGGEGHPRYYVEPATGALAARIDDSDALEGQSFSNLHKWTFVDINKDLRDALMALFAFANVAVACMGLTLFVRRRKAAAVAWPHTQGGRMAAPLQ